MNIDWFIQINLHQQQSKNTMVTMFCKYFATAKIQHLLDIGPMLASVSRISS